MSKVYDSLSVLGYVAQLVSEHHRTLSNPGTEPKEDKKERRKRAEEDTGKAEEGGMTGDL